MNKIEMNELDRIRHSTAHIMAAAICRLYDNVKLDIGPPTEDGFYYDFDMNERLSTDDFEKIEKIMEQIIQEDHPFTREEVSRDKAKEMLKGQKYKLERLNDIPDGEPITFYTCGEFTDLCRGPHIESTGEIKAFQLVNVAGSYYRGKETNPMLQRLYGTSFKTPKDLRLHLKQLDEAKKETIES